MPSLRIKSLLLIASLTFFAGHAFAGPKVLVSVAPLHSLVSSLMKGAGQPELLMQEVGHTRLSSEQVRAVIQADMIIWSGAGLETALANTLDHSVPAAKHNLVTLSNTVPLLTRRDIQPRQLLADRQATRDLEFWMDPRLAIMAVRNLTPRLVRLDPDNQELYLDNEIALIKELKHLEREISQTLLPAGGTMMASASDTSPYFAHRFNVPLATKGHMVKARCTGPMATSHPGTKHALNAGPGFYFSMMRNRANSLAGNACTSPNSNPSRHAGNATSFSS